MKKKRDRIYKKVVLLCSLVFSLCFGFTSLAEKEKEDNGSFARANEISIGIRVQGAISSIGDEDYYKFTVKKSGSIKVSDFQISTENNCFDVTILYLYDKNHRVIYQQKTPDTEGYDETSSSINVDPGEYFIRITQCGNSGSAIPYAIKVSFTEKKGEYKWNDFAYFSKAQEIKLGVRKYGKITKIGKCDYYKFKIPQSGIVTITGARGTYSGDKSDWKTVLYNARKERIEAGINTWGDVQIGLAAGTYYLKVKAGQSGGGNYCFRVSYQKNSMWERELNDTFEKSTPIKLGTYMYGTMNQWNDVDCYSFVMPYDGKVQFDNNCLLEYLTATLYDASYRESTAKLLYRLYITDEECTISLKKGTYYIKINQDYLYWDDDGDNEYHFRVKIIGGAPSVKLDQTQATLTLPKKKTLQLKATVTGADKKVIWKSSNEKVAEVSISGKITAKSTGKSVITATANGKTASCEITVNQDVNQIYKEYLSKSVIILPNGKSIKPNYFTIANVDKRGVMELLIREEGNGSTGNLGAIYICTAINGKVEYTGTVWNAGTVPRISEYGGIYTAWTSMNGTFCCLTSIKNRKLYNSRVLSKHTGNSETMYYQDGQKITVAQYEEALKTLQASLKNGTSFQKNNAENRKKAFG